MKKIAFVLFVSVMLAGCVSSNDQLCARWRRDLYAIELKGETTHCYIGINDHYDHLHYSCNDSTVISDMGNHSYFVEHEIGTCIVELGIEDVSIKCRHHSG